jgi:hypothetical protein
MIQSPLRERRKGCRAHRGFRDLRGLRDPRGLRAKGSRVSYCVIPTKYAILLGHAGLALEKGFSAPLREQRLLIGFEVEIPAGEERKL